MKKLLAIVVALMMAVGCMGAFAEEAAPVYATETQAFFDVNDDLVMMFAPMLGAEDAECVGAVLGVLESLYIDAIQGENVLDVALMTGEETLGTIVVGTDGEDVLYVSDLFPHYALKANLAELLASLEDMSAQLSEMPGVETALPIDFQMPEFTEEEIAALTEAITAYGEDINAFVASVQASAVINQNGTVTLPLTMQQVTGLVDALVARLNADETLKSFLNKVLEQVNAQQAEDEQVTVDQLLEMLNGMVESMKAQEDTQLGAVTMGQSENGEALLDILVMGMVEVQIITAEDGMAMTALFSQTGITDLDAQVAAVESGENAQDLVVKAVIATEADEAGQETTTATIDLLFGGMDIVIAESETKIGEGTADFASQNIFTLYCEMLGGEILSCETDVIACDDPEAPSAEGLIIVDLASATDEEREALTQDVVNYGVPALVARYVLAQPDQAAALVDALAKAKKDQDYDYSDDYSYEYDGETIEEEDDGIDLTGEWTAQDGTVLVLSADGSFSLTWKGDTYTGTWSKFYSTLMLDTEFYGLGCDYSEDTISMTLAFVPLEFHR